MLTQPLSWCLLEKSLVKSKRRGKLTEVLVETAYVKELKMSRRVDKRHGGFTQ